MSPDAPAPGPVATRAQVARDHTVFAQRDPAVLVSTALRTKSIHSREILAEMAWPGHTPADLSEWVASGQPWPQLREEMDPASLGRYGQVLALQTGMPQERAAGRAILEAVVAAGAIEELPPRVTELLLQLRLADRDADGVTDLLDHPAVRGPMGQAVAADLANPALFPGRDEGRWLEALNTALTSGGMAPLELLPTPPGDPEAEQPTVFDRLSAPTAAPVAATSLVTVLMSAFRPGPPLLTALRSLVEQTWANLEILVVDDASGPDYAAILDQAEALDPRIRVIRKAVNGGTYRARNTAMRRASGDFLTVLDSDDWLHPQAIEVGVTTMLNSPGTMATRGQGVRISEDLELNRPGYLPRVTSAPSLMFRVHPVVDRIGYFDPTSKSADTEYARRIEAAFHQPIINLPVVVTFLRGGDTLSASEFSRGWRHTARHAYKCAYTPWHARIRAGQTSPFLDPDRPRVFPEPRRWAKPVAPDLGAPAHFDLCLAGDWRRWGGPQRSMMEEIRAARDAGLRVAVMHLEAFRFMTSKDDPLCAAVTELINTGAVEWIHPDDNVDVDVLMIRYPPILQYPPAPGRRQVRAKHVLIMANQAPLEPDGSDQRYVVADVTERTRELFGQDPWWVPQGPALREVLRQQDPNIRLTPWDNPGLIDVNEWTVRTHHAPRVDDGPIVVGRYSRDNIIKFAPTLERIRTGYEFGPDYEVRMMGAVNTISKLLTALELTREDLPDNWVLTRHKSKEVVDFLAELDFFLYLDNPHMHEAFGRTILEAAASGVLTIAHPKHRATFGDTVDYAEPGQAQALIADYVANPQRYAERVARSRAEVKARFGHAGFVERLRALSQTTAANPLAEAPTYRPDVRVAVEPAPAGSYQPPLIRAEGDWTVRTEPIRSAADAERADRISVVHAPAAAEQVARWWGAAMSDHPGDRLPQVMIETAPPEVVALVTHRDRLLHVATRTGQDAARHDAADQHLLGLSGITLPEGWSATAQWA